MWRPDRRGGLLVEGVLLQGLELELQVLDLGCVIRLHLLHLRQPRGLDSRLLW